MRIPATVLAAVVTLTAASSGLFAAESPRSLSVDEIVAKNIAARGGEAKIKAIQSLRMTGKAQFAFGDNQIEAVFGQIQRRPLMFRQEVTLQGLTAVSAYDGKVGWNLQPFQGRRDAEQASADEARQLAEQADIEGPLVDWKQKGHTVEYLGTEDIDGTPALKLRVNLKGGNTEYIFLDPDYFLEIRTETVTRVRGAESITDSDLGSYEQVAGVWFPFSIEQSQPGGNGRQRYNIERAEANVDAAEALFTFPPAGTPIVQSVMAAPGAAAPEASTPPPAAGARPAVFDSGTVSGLGIRNIGSAAMSGRVSVVTGRKDDGKTTLFIGAASGGVWRSFDGGTTFKPVFDKEPVQSIGAITIDPSNAKTIWVGTGESWMRNSVSIGDGIYKSTDGGETWTNMGLPNSEHIVRILVHPKQSDTVYACVPGKLWSDSADRGLYKTTDGGAHWSLVLKGANLSTGCSSVTMDPKNPDALMAGMWDFRRKAWTFRSGGDGPTAASGSGLYRSEDGGRSWTELTEKTNAGLPPKPWGRVETVIAPTDSKVVYSLIESAHSALYRSSDGGRTWEKRDHSQSMVWRPFYFGRLVVDPTNAERLYKPGGSISVSEDGGKSFSYSGGGGHGDWHDIWIDPENTKHAVAGDDGGLWVSQDGGNRWLHAMNLPVSQFYHVALDGRDPYEVYGGLQDNSSWIGESAHPGGITNAQWQPIPIGDGFWTVPDPTDPDALYTEGQGGYAVRFDRKTATAKDIQPKAGYGEKLHYNWNTPLVVSSKGTVYIGAQFLFRSHDHGDSWERISPDLTSHDPEKQKQEESGGVTVDNSAAEENTTIYAIAESPSDANVIWAGTSDGNLQLTRDGGKHWDNVVRNIKGLPPAPWVSSIEASRYAPGTAYATIDFHMAGDMTPWAFRTTDFGKTWTRLAGPDKGVRGYAHVIKEDPVKSSLLFLGTEFGLWISDDGGTTWAQFSGGDFPSVAVRDIAVHPRDHDLVHATHGRGIWIIDDITPLRNLSSDALGKTAAFLGGRTVQQRMPSTGGWVEGDATFVGQNPAGGAVITYYQRTRHLFGPIKLEILDASGKVIDSLAASKRRGINRVAWTMQVPPPRVPRAAQLAFYSSIGPRVPPGTYTARLTKGGETIEEKIDVAVDRRAPYGAAERKEQFDAVMKAHALFGEMSELVDRIDAARAKATQAKDSARLEKLDAIKKKIVATKEGGAITGEERIREQLDHAYGALSSWEGKPEAYQVERVDVLKRELEDVRREFDALESGKAPAKKG
ncbi:MAG TPA: sialidase [Thermoanaerobaculia bacterium]|nr:sialidase [Thermoanaerobaculia bacterium]